MNRYDQIVFLILKKSEVRETEVSAEMVVSGDFFLNVSGRRFATSSPAKSSPQPVMSGTRESNFMTNELVTLARKPAETVAIPKRRITVSRSESAVASAIMDQKRANKRTGPPPNTQPTAPNHIVRSGKIFGSHIGANDKTELNTNPTLARRIASLRP